MDNATDAAFELPGYEILELAGEGGMARVWKARQLSLDRLVAIKVLSAEMSADSEAAQRFQEEARAAARLSHPGLVRVHDAGQHNGLAYFTMEFLPGPTVGNLLDEHGRLPEDQGLAIAESVARALDYAWSHARVIHCDVKPDNLMIDEDGTIKLADMGLARVVERRVGEEGRQQYVTGTPNYTSPEQAFGVSDLDCRTDIYALGATLYHVLTGTLPFGGDDPGKVLERQIEDCLPDPMSVVPSISSGMAWLIEKLMVKDREQRYSDWSEVLLDVLALRDQGALFSQMPQAGQSTIQRCSARKPAALRSRAVPRRAVRVEARTSSPPRRPRRRISLLRTFFWLLVIGGTIAGSWHAIRLYQDLPPPPPPEEPDVTSILPPRSRLANEAEETSRPAPRPAPPPAERRAPEEERKTEADSDHPVWWWDGD